MAEEDVQIKLTSTSDTKGVEKAKQKLKELKDEAKNAEGAFNKVNKSSAEAAGAITAIGGAVSVVKPEVGALIMTTGQLTSIVKGLGTALKSLLFNPATLAIAAVVGAAAATFAYFKKEAREAKERADELFESVTKGIENRVAKENREIAASYAEMGHRIADAADQLQHFNEISDIRLANSRALANAQKSQSRSAELSAAGSTEAREALKRRYAREDIDTDLSRTQEDIRTEADRAYGSGVRADFASRRDQIQAELDKRLSKNGTVAQAERLVGNARTVSGSSDFSDEKRRAANDSLPQFEANLAAEVAKVTELERQLSDLDREERQAKEKHNALLEKLNAATESATARKMELDAQETAARDKEREKILGQISKIEKDREVGTDNHAVKIAGNYTTNGGFASAAAKAAAGVSASFSVENKAQAARDKQIKLLTEQLEKLDRIARGTEDNDATFG